MTRQTIRFLGLLGRVLDARLLMAMRWCGWLALGLALFALCCDDERQDSIPRSTGDGGAGDMALSEDTGASDLQQPGPDTTIAIDLDGPVDAVPADSDTAPGPDMSSPPADLGLLHDLGADLALADLGASQDLATASDLAPSPDVALLVDLGPSPDVALPDDLGLSADSGVSEAMCVARLDDCSSAAGACETHCGQAQGNELVGCERSFGLCLGMCGGDPACLERCSTRRRECHQYWQNWSADCKADCRARLSGCVAEDPTQCGDVLVTFVLDATGRRLDLDAVVPIDDPPPPGGNGAPFIVGNLPELGSWTPNLVAMTDAGQEGDALAGDGLWTFRTRVPRFGRVEYKYTVGAPGDGWAGSEEFPLTNRGLTIEDLDGDGQVQITDVFADRPAEGRMGWMSVVEGNER